MEPEGSLPNLQVPANCPYLKPDRFKSIPPHPHPTSWRTISIIHPSVPSSSKWFLSLRFRHQSPGYDSLIKWSDFILQHQIGFKIYCFQISFVAPLIFYILSVPELHINISHNLFFPSFKQFIQQSGYTT